LLRLIYGSKTSNSFREIYFNADPLDAIAFANAATYKNKGEIKIWISDVSMRGRVEIFLTEVEALIDAVTECIQWLTAHIGFSLSIVGRNYQDILSNILEITKNNPILENINALRQALENFNQEYLENIWSLEAYGEIATVYSKSF